MSSDDGPGQEPPTATCLGCDQPISDDQQCVPVLTGIPAPYVLVPNHDYIHINCLLGVPL